MSPTSVHQSVCQHLSHDMMSAVASGSPVAVISVVEVCFRIQVNHETQHSPRDSGYFTAFPLLSL